MLITTQIVTTIDQTTSIAIIDARMDATTPIDKQTADNPIRIVVILIIVAIILIIIIRMLTRVIPLLQELIKTIVVTSAISARLTGI
jgi:hypothetical protein